MLDLVNNNITDISLFVFGLIFVISIIILIFNNKVYLLDLLKKIHANDKGEQSWSRWANTTVILLTFILTYIQAFMGSPLSDSVILGLIGMTLGAKIAHKHVENKNNKPL